MSETATGQVWPQPVETPSSEAPQPLTGEKAPIASIDRQNLNVHQCAACDGQHENIEVHDYNRPQPPFTHWYMCPTLGDPVPIALAMLKEGQALELNGPICQALAEAQIAGRFMVAVFMIKDGQLLLRRTTHKFPTAEYFESKESPGCLGTFKKNLEQETGAQQPAVMKEAASIKPLRELLGNGQLPDRVVHKLPPEVAARIKADNEDLQKRDPQ
jgi:hypothetical protein